MALNYSLAPHAELARKAFLAGGRSRQAGLIEGQIFRNRTDDRTWFVQNFRPGHDVFNTVQVLQQDAQRQYCGKLPGRTRDLSPGNEDLGIRKREDGPLRCRRKHSRREILSVAQDRQLERNTVSSGQRQCARRVSEPPGAAPDIFAFNADFPATCSRHFARIFNIDSLCPGPAWWWSVLPRHWGSAIRGAEFWPASPARSFLFFR